MVDLSFRKLLGDRIAWALGLAFLVAALWIPAGAQAATGVPGVPSAVTALPGVPATAQAAVGAALAQAGTADVDRASVAAVPAAPSASSPPPPPSAPPPPAQAATPAITVPVAHVDVPESTSPASSLPIPDPAPVVESGADLALSTPRPDPAASVAREPTGGVSDGDVRRARPAGRARPVNAGHRGFGHGGPLAPARPIELGAAQAPGAAAGWSSPARTQRVASPPVAVVAPHPAHRRVANAAAAGTAAAATAVEPVSPSAPASLPPGGTGGVGAGAGAGPAGAAAVALLVLAGVTLLRSLLPGLMTLDLLPWRSAVPALPPERPG
jgi:hypothetical protein